MKKVDSGECFTPQQDNIFSEFQPFAAEQYYSQELSKSPKEVDSFSESFNNQSTQSTKTEGDAQSDFDKIKKEYDKSNGDTPSSSSSPSSTPSTNSVDASPTAAPSQAASTSASTTASTAANVGGVASGAAAGAGATAVAAVVIVSAAVTGGFIADFSKYVGNNTGADYVSITVDMDEIISNSDKAYALSAQDFSIELKGGGSSQLIPIVSGKHSYLLTGLLPDKTYTYSLICSNPAMGSNSNCYSNTFKTLSSIKPSAVWDELNSSITLDNATQTASVNYSVYLSDYEKVLNNSTLYICSSEQTDFSNVSHVIYSDGEIDNNDFFKGSADGITYDELYLYVVGQTTIESQTETSCLFSRKIEVGLPDGWDKSTLPEFEVSESAEVVNSQPDGIYVSGSLSKLNENYTYSAYVTQYAQDGTTLVERQEVGLTVDPANMTYSVNCEAYYGVKKFKYVIYTTESGSEVVVYESADKTFTASQEFGATYNVIEPINAKYEYTAEKLTITVGPAFTSDSDVYSYKLVVYCNDKVYGEYQGTGVAVFEITDFADLDYIEFTYTDIGTFADGEHVYETHSPMFIEFGSIFLDLGTTSITMGDGRIWGGGVIDSINENFTYYAYVSQYAQDGTPLCEREEVTLNINAESMEFWFECATYYEVKQFRYVIYTYDNHGDEVIVYDDGEREFTASQEFNATYTKVAPADASIKYNSNSVIITVDPKFTSKHANEEYKLVVTNSTGEVFGEYQGTGVATISITDCVGLDEINFTYYDIGKFADGEREFAQHTTTPVTGKAYFVVDESAEAATGQPNRIAVSGKLNKLNENFTYSAYVAQYAEGGTALVEREEVTLNINTENMTYSLECGAYYGVHTFKYVIYTNDGSKEIAVYESEKESFTASQAFAATYNKVEPADASIEYTAEKITITVDPAFTSEHDNYEYKLVITNSTGQVYGVYQGTGVANVEITDFTGLDKINFTYYDIGTFAGGEEQLTEHTTAGVEFNYIFIDVGLTSFINQPDSIAVSGKLNKLNENFTYSAYVAQYAEDGTTLVERQEVGLSVDPANMTYSVNCEAYYGVKTFKYVIYTNDGSNEIAVYESEQESFTASQAFAATYNKVEPADATIAYAAEKITITVDPAFTSEHDNYEYKLVVTNSTGQVYGVYQGTGVAAIEITDFTGLDKINFTYYDMGTFAGGEEQLTEHTTAGVEFNYIFIDVGLTSFVNQPDSIAVNGSLNKLNENFTYSAYVVQYAEDGTTLVERQEVGLTVDPANMTYSLNCEAYYGVNTFKYVIYTNDGSNEIAVYESEQESFTASQAFAATYNKVEPADATIEYAAEKITITVDPEFDSTYSNYEYKLVVTNSTGQVYGKYQGTGVANVEITDFTGLDEINFTYYDMGTFAGGEEQLTEHTTEGVAFCMPTLSLGAEYGFNGQYFTLSYTCDMDYDYANASIDIAITNGGVKVYAKNVDGVAASGTIILDNYEGEFGNVKVTATLNFKDNQSDGAIHSLELAQAEYAMNYSFEVSKVVADVSGFSTEAMAVTLNFNSLLPNGYMIKITDEANSIDLTSDLTNEYSISDLLMDTEYNLTVQVTDADGNAWGASKTVNISKTAAEAEYISPIMSSLNPGDALVTYNDDGTINIYRQMIPDAFGRDTISNDERIYYNAFIQGYYFDGEGKTVKTKGYDVIGRGKYAVIENIPNQNYTFVYYRMFNFNGVSYVMYAEMPSGSVENVYDCGVASAIVSGGQTTISLNITAYGELANKIIVNGKEYTYTTYSGEDETNPTLVIDGEIEVSEVTIFFTKQGGNYNAYSASGKITIKGSKYGKHTITLTPVEA